MYDRQPTLSHLAEALHNGSTTSRALMEECLTHIEDSAGEGKRVFLAVDVEGARKAADIVDQARAANHALPPLAGIPISVKDLFDVQGQVTTAGSRILLNAAPAKEDAPALARLREAGLVFIGRTNMTEFAFSGLGLNPHFGTPRNPWQRETGFAPGGSSSGAAVSVTDGMAHAAIGTDTGGSCRIPAAFTGIVGYKPTKNFVPADGAIPLSPTLDSVGPLARSVDCCARLFSILSGQPVSLSAINAGNLRLALPQTLVFDEIDATVAALFNRAVGRLSAANIRIEDADFPMFARIPALNAQGGLPSIESYEWHRPLLTTHASEYDPNVLTRILRGKDQDARALKTLVQGRKEVQSDFEREAANFDALILPTVAILPPRLADLDTAPEFFRANALALRNAGVFNFVDGCAISIPIHEAGEPPVGLMIAGPNRSDKRILEIASLVESILRRT